MRPRSPLSCSYSSFQKQALGTFAAMGRWEVAFQYREGLNLKVVIFLAMGAISIRLIEAFRVFVDHPSLQRRLHLETVV